MRNESSRDVTEGEPVEDGWSRSESLYATLVNSVRGIVWEADGCTFQFTFVSRQAEQILGYPVEQWLADPSFWRNHTHPDDVDWCARFCADTTARGLDHEFEYRMVAADGRIVWLHDIVTVIIAGDGSVRLRGIMTDITERKRAEEALRESERRFQLASQATDDVIYDWDFRSGYLWWNPKITQQVYGYAPKDVRHNVAWWKERVHPEDHDRVLAILSAATEGTATAKKVELEYRFRRADGSYAYVYERGFIMRDEDGAPLRMIGSMMDITERRQTEERLKASSEQLRALMVSLRKAREEEGIRIAREIHDELGSALTSLRWDLEGVDKTLAESDGRPPAPALREKIGVMLGLIDATVNTVRRISSELRPSVLDDLGLAAAIEWQAQQFQARTGIVCRCDCSADNIELGQEQATAVFRIFQEALTNVLRHAQATKINIGIRENAGEFVLAVRDDGRGITEEESLGPYSLGLLGMRERAHLIGGSVEIAGVAGEGTTVTLRVPTTGAAHA